MHSLSDFVLLTTEGDWQRYKNEIARKVTGHVEENNLFNAPSNFNFPQMPDSFPCLSAALIVEEPPDDDSVKSYQVNCCYVYQDDAESLLKLGKPIKAPVALLSGPEIVSPPIKQKSTVHQLFSIVVALTKELEGIGAVKKKRLLQAMKKEYENIDFESSDFISLFSSQFDSK